MGIDGANTGKLARGPVGFLSCLVIANLMGTGSVAAQTSGPTMPLVTAPTTGQILHQLVPAPELPARATPEMTIERGQKGAIAKGGVRILLKGVRFSGVTRIPLTTLQAAVRHAVDQYQTLGDLEALTIEIAQVYRRQGYLLASAYLPPQRVTDGIIEIAVLEGRLGKIRVENKTTLRQERVETTLADLPTDEIVTTAALERSLLLLGDHAGIASHSSLVPGGMAGQSDLVVRLEPGDAISAVADADNFGSLHTGQIRGSGAVGFQNPFGMGDLLRLNAVSAGEGFNYGGGSYETALPHTHLRIGGSYAFLHYALVSPQFVALQADGDVHTAGGYGQYPLLRGRRFNLYARGDYTFRSLEDRGAVNQFRNHRYIHRGALSLQGDWKDDVFGGGIGRYRFMGGQGVLSLEDAAPLSQDSLSARTDGYYQKIEMSLLRLQRITDTITLYGAASGQVAMGNLDSSEKFFLGGPQGVRAYPQGEAGGDDGYLLNLELRYNLPRISQVPGAMVVAAFWDQGTTRTNHNAFSPGRNNRTLQATGTMVTWAMDKKLQISATAALPVGDETAQSEPHKDVRIWLHLTTQF